MGNPWVKTRAQPYEGDVRSRINNNLGKVFIEEIDGGWDLSGLRTKEGASWGSRLVLP